MRTRKAIGLHDISLCMIAFARDGARNFCLGGGGWGVATLIYLSRQPPKHTYIHTFFLLYTYTYIHTLF